MLNSFSYEQIILNSFTGDPEKITEATNRYLEEEEDIPSLVQSLFDTLLNHKNETIRIASCLALTNLIERGWDQITDEISAVLQKQVLSLYPQMSNQLMPSFSLLVLNVLGKLNLEWQEFDQFLKNEPTDEKMIRFFIDLLWNYSEQADLGNIATKLERIEEIILLSFKIEDWDLRFKAISVLGTYLDFLPDQFESVAEHLTMIQEFAKQTVNLSDRQCSLIWTAIGRVFCFQPPDPSYIEPFIEFAFQAANQEKFCPETRFIPLSIFESSIEYFPSETTIKIAELCVKIASNYLEYVEDLPFSFLTYFQKSLQLYSHDEIYEFVRQQTVGLLKSENQQERIIGLCNMVILVEKIPDKTFEDIPQITETISIGLSRDNPLVLQAILVLIGAFQSFYAWNLIDVEQWIQRIIELLVHPNTDIRYYARLAAINAMEISRIPIPGVVKCFLSISDKIYSDDKIPFLNLVALAIKNEKLFDFEEANILADLSNSLISQTEDVASVIGGISIGVSILLTNQRIHGKLLPITLKGIESCITSEDAEIVLYGFEKLSELFDIIKPDDVSKYIEQMIALMNLTDSGYANTRNKALNILSKICEWHPDHLLYDEIIAIARQWMNSGIPIYQGWALHICRNLAPCLSSEWQLEAINDVYNLCKTTKYQDVAENAFKTMKALLIHCKDSVRETIYLSAYTIILNYIEGDLEFLGNVPPIGTDIDFLPYYVITKLVIQVLEFPHEQSRSLMKMSFALYERGNQLVNEIMFMFWKRVVEKGNIATEAELQRIIDIGLKCFSCETPPELIMMTASFINTLIMNDLISKEIIQEKIPVVREWWNKCTAMETHMKITIANLTLLIWVISYKYYLREQLKDIIEYTVRIQFPPDDPSLLGKMCKQLLTTYRLYPTFDPITLEKAAISVAKIMLLDPIYRKNAELEDEVYEGLATALRETIKLHPHIKDLIYQKIVTKESRKQIIDSILNE